MIKYSKESFEKSITLSGVGYYFSTLHICAVKEDKILAFDDVGILSLSLDGGKSYGITLNLTGICNIITRARIYANGNIMWASHTTAYYSTDNLATYHQSTVLGIDGNAFVASTYDNFKAITYTDDVFINGVQIDIWGAYSIEDGTAYDNINAWYTIDSGITIKSCFKAGVSLSGQSFRHIHGIFHIPLDDSFWMITGDRIVESYFYWNKGTYDINTDTWSWSNMIADGSERYKVVGITYINGNIYIGSDASQNGAYKGVWRIPYADITSGGSWVQVCSSDWEIIGVFGKGSVIIMPEGRTNKVLYISKDYGVTWTKVTLTGGPTLQDTLGGYYNDKNANNDGYYVFDIVDNIKTFKNFTSGTVLMLRIK